MPALEPLDLANNVIDTGSPYVIVDLDYFTTSAFFT
jgi:hypothetical protein